MDTPIVANATLQGRKTYDSIVTTGKLTLCDPITQICKRIVAFFKADSDITCVYQVNNHKPSNPVLDPDTGEHMTRKMDIEGETRDVYLFEDHFCEFRIIVNANAFEKAQALANVVRHRHNYPEFFDMTSQDGAIGYRNHILLVRVMVVDGVDPDEAYGGGASRDTADDDTDKGIREIFGIDPINWNDLTTGCNDRLSPLDTSESTIPKGVPEEYEQRQWEATAEGTAWKWRWLKTALQGNKNITTISHEFFDGQNTWRFIECSKIPVTFGEDSLTSYFGLTTVLPADLFGLVFAVFGKYQIDTYARKIS